MRFFLAPLTENLAVMGFLIFYMPKNADLLSNSGARMAQIETAPQGFAGWKAAPAGGPVPTERLFMRFTPPQLGQYAFLHVS